MIHLAFRVPGEAVGKQEAASTCFNRAGRLVAHIYTKRKSRAYMNHVADCARRAIRESGFANALPTDDALAIEIVCFFARPKSVRMSRKYPLNRIDCTNIQKGIEDALHKPKPIAFRNDCHVVSIKTDKRYCAEGMEPHTRVEIWTAGAKRYADIRSMRPGG